MASLGRLTIDLVANLGGFERDMGRAQRTTARSMSQVRREMRATEREMQRARDSLRRLGMQFTALAGVSLAVAVREVRNFARQADELDKLSRATGASVEQLQRLGFAAEQSGTDLNTVSRALVAMQRNIQGAADGLSTMDRALGRVNLTTQQLEGLSPDQQFLRIADAIANHADQQERLTTATDLFGSRVAIQLLPLLNQGSAGIRELGDQLAQTGAIMSGEAVAASVRFNDELNRLRRTFEGVRVELFSQIITPLADFVQFLNTEQGMAILRERLDAVRNAAMAVGAVIATRFVVQVTAASIAMVRATADTLRLTAAKAGLQGASTRAAVAVTGLTMALRTLMGPIGLAATAIGVFTLSSRDSTASLFEYEDAVRRLRVEMRDFRDEQEAVATRDHFAEQLEAAQTQLHAMREELAQLQQVSRSPFEGMATGISHTEIRIAQLTSAIVGQEEAVEQMVVELEEAEAALADYRERIDSAAASTAAFNDEVRSREVLAFMRRIEDLADALEGVEARAMRRFVRMAAEANEMLQSGDITAKEYAEAIDVLRRTYEQAANAMTDDLGTREVEAFLRSMQDLEAQLAGPAAEAQLRFNRQLDIARQLYEAGKISADDYARSVRLLGEAFAQATQQAGVADGFIENIAGAVTQGITRGFGRLDPELLLRGGFGDIANILGQSVAESVGFAIGEQLGTKAGEALGEAIGGSIGAALGSAAGPIGGAIGQVIGSIIGRAIFGEKDPKFQIGGPTGFADTGGRARGQFETMFGATLFRFRSMEDQAERQIMDALIQFDNAMAAIISDEAQFRAVEQALRDFAFDSADEGATIQDLLEHRFEAVLSTFDEFTQNMVRSVFGLEAQAERLAEILELQRRAVFEGILGFGTEEDLIFRMTQMQRGGESLVQTFDRFIGTMEALDAITGVTGVSLASTHAGLIDFGDELMRVFGDNLPAFERSLQRVFDTFFEADEILEHTAEAARARATRLLEDLGVAVTDSMLTAEGFRALFESMLPDISPQQLAILVEAGVAVADMVDATEQLTGARADEADGARELERIIDNLVGAMQSVEETILLAPLSDFNREMVSIERNLHRNIRAINQAAGAAIDQATAENMLARAHQAAAIQAVAAVERLEASTRRLVEQVFGAPLDGINAQIAALQENATAAAQAIANQNAAMQRLIAFADQLMVGHLSPLPSRHRLTEGMRQLRAASAAGDVGAVQQLAQQVLQIGRERFATGPEFEQLFNEVQAIIRGTTPAPMETQPVEIVSSPELVELLRRRDEIADEIAQADRRAASFEIAQAVADISRVTGDSFDDVANRLGFSLEELAEALGMDMEELDALLESMLVDTSQLADTLETFAQDIRDAIQEMTNAIIGAVGAAPPDDMVDDPPVKRDPSWDDQRIPPTIREPAFPVEPTDPTPTPPVFTPPDRPVQPPGDGTIPVDDTLGDIARATNRTAGNINELIRTIERDQLRSTRTFEAIP